MRTVQIAEIIDYLDKHHFVYSTCIVSDKITVEGASALSEYRENTITWLKAQEKTEGVNFQNVKLLIAEYGLKGPKCNTIFVKGSKAAFFGLIDDLIDPEVHIAAIGKHTYISSNVTIGNDVQIGNNCVLDGKITIGNRTKIMDGTVIVNNCDIGDDTIIQPLCVIGIDGFGYYEDEEKKKHMVKHHGGVIIGSNVFVGSHSNIARGTLGNTIIQDGVKIAPSTHIGHNNRIEKNSVIICSNIYGSCVIGEDAYLTACTLKNQHIVGKHALVGMGAVVTQNVDPDTVVVGIPAKPLRKREDYDI